LDSEAVVLMLRRSLAVLAVVAVLATSGQAAAARRKAAPKPVPAAASTYKVVQGDNLSDIAKRFGTTVSALAQLNRLRNTHRIRIGAVLKVPAAAVLPAPQGDPRLPDRLRRAPERLALMKTFDQAAARHKVPANLLKAVTWMESGWQNDKVSSTKALGIGQLMPTTVVFVNQTLLRGAKLDPRKPADNINLSARYLAWLLKQTKGDVATAVAGYYQGLTSVRRQGPLAETTVYVNNVVALRGRF
jgi:soluble lytic murein transglycosylase-like protein